MYGRRTKITGWKAIISLIFFSFLLIFVLVYLFIAGEMVGGIILSPFIILCLIAFYDGITTELNKFKK